MRRLFFAAALVLLAASTSLFAVAPPTTSPSATTASPPKSQPDGEYHPQIAAASNEGERAIKSFAPARGLKVELFAAEPQVANVVAFTFDDRGRLFAAETFRQNQNTGAEDNRSHGEWLDDDLAAQTVEDRLAYMKKHRGDLSSYTREHDRICLVEDTDHDGRADKSTVFADGFNDVLDGTGAGILVRGGDVFYTCIPNLWKMHDVNGDGRIDKQNAQNTGERVSLHRGYGVRFAFRGHDMHGLTIGPDGMIYYSIGDRGYHVVTPQGTLARPDAGAVFRCNPDGSDLEVVHYGLRNPQELAFNEYGDLFTGDNNSDSGDRARWVQIVEGADSGWRMYYQYLSDRGPWNREKLWHPQHEGQPAYIVPPIVNLADGPSGLAYYPGTGLGERYRGHFFLCDFRGGAAQSGVHSFSLKPKGASFEIADLHHFLWSMLVTDVGFGSDRNVYISDWVEGWNGAGKARIYRVFDPTQRDSDQAKQVKALLAEGFAKRPTAELVALLAHGDMRIRREAQFALVERGETAPLAEVAAHNGNQLARIHAIWGLGQLSRKASPDALARYLAPIALLTKDPDAEIRAQAAKTLGRRAWPPAVEPLVALLADASARVQAFALLALSRQAHHADAAVLKVLEANADRDPIVRHAASMALIAAMKSDPAVADRLVKLSAAQTPAAVRLGILLALRRMGAASAANYLNDPLASIVDEAARAIHDDAGSADPAAWRALASLAERRSLSDSTARRALNAAYRLGGRENADRIAAAAARSDLAAHLRVEALQMLAAWEKPSPKDRVTGMWRPIVAAANSAARSASDAAAALRPVLGAVVAAPGEVGKEAARTAAALGIREIGPALVALASDAAHPAEARGEAIAALVTLHDSHARAVVENALAQSDPQLRAAALRAFAKLDATATGSKLAAAAEKGTVVEQQTALDVAASLANADGDRVISAAVDRLLAGSVAAEVRLDVLAAAQRRATDALRAKLGEYESRRPKDDPLAAYAESLHGGDVHRGRALFFDSSKSSCVRCHQLAEVGGLVGPNLTQVAKDPKHDRRYFLEAIVNPNKTIAEGFQSTQLILEDGQSVSGIVKAEDAATLRLMTAEGQLLTVAKADIDQRQTGRSAMPDDLPKHLSKSDLRDLVEFLSSLK
jgi:quinoprotein glucose dehydrogenase